MGTDAKTLTFSQKMLYFSQACDAFVYRKFKTLGHMLHDYQWRFLIIPLLLMLPMMAGLSRISDQTEDDPSKLYAPSDTQAERDESKILQNFGLNTASASVFAVTSPEGDNVLTTDNVLTLYDAWDNVTMFEAAYNGANFNLSGVCLKVSGVCRKNTILAFYDYNRTLIAELSDTELWQTIVDADYVATEQDGQQVNLSSIAVFSTDGVVKNTRFTFVLEQLTADSTNGASEKVAKWGVKLGEVIRGRGWGALKLYSDSRGEVSEAVSSAFAYDLVLLPLGYILLVVYATGVLSRNSSVHTNGSLALISVFAVCIAILATFGLGLWFGITFSSLIITLAFLLLGLGTDDTYVLVAAFQHPDVMYLEPRERVAEAMARAGSSISVTSLTDLVAFLAGSYSSIPVVEAFCQYVPPSAWIVCALTVPTVVVGGFIRFAAIGVTLDFFLQITFFAVAMYMAGERESKEKLDCFCCLTASKPDKKLIGKGEFSRATPEMLTVFLQNTYAPRLLSVPGKVVAMSLGGLLLALGIYGCTQITVDFQYDWFIPDNSYYQDTITVRERYWGSQEVPVSVYSFEGDYSSETTQTQFSQMTTELDDNDLLVSGSCINWWPEFVSFAEVNASASMQTVNGERIVAPAHFDDTLLNFYNDDAGSAFTGYLTLTSDSVLRLTEISCRDDAGGSGIPYRTKQMDKMREIADICSSVGAVAWGPAYWSHDAHKIFLREIIVNLAIALGGVFLITTLMLGSLVPSMIVTLLLIVIDIEVLGSIYLSGDYFNSVTGINLVLAVGLSVDAVAHITHAFLAHDGGGNERAAAALTEIGRPVFNGAISTMIVLLPLAGAQTYVFQVFFRTFMAIIGYSAFNGLVVLPVILSVIQPTSFNTIRNKLGLEEQDRGGKKESEFHDQDNKLVVMTQTTKI